MDAIKNLLTQKYIPLLQKEGVTIVRVADADHGFSVASTLLPHIVDTHTLLLLSGGRTPKELYKTLASTGTIEPGAVGMVDERYGRRFHENSNEHMLRETGLLRYLDSKAISYYPILTESETREQTAEEYDLIIRELVEVYDRKVGILGIGLDGHTAGIPSNSSKLKINSEIFDDKNRFVTEYTDTVGSYGERVTMTFPALSQFDVFLVLVFGEDKKSALENVFSDGSEEEIPGRFYKRPEIAKKTLLITDQTI